MDASKAREVYLDKIRGSLWGGAIGDALGYPVEFLSEGQIHMMYGKEGITEYKLDKKSGKALISDDTQMTLFTANGILAGETRSCLMGFEKTYYGNISESYKDWLNTQELSFDKYKQNRKNEKLSCFSWLCDVSELFSRRAPGGTCISALSAMSQGKVLGSVSNPINNSKGCGGVMRVAPLALRFGDEDIEKVDMGGAQIAAITHGHSLGYMPAAVLTHIISRIIYPIDKNISLKDIVIEARNTVHNLFADDEHIEELDRLIDLAVKLSENNDPDITNIHKLGEGWVAEETLAIAIYCSLKYQDDFSKGLIVSVNHVGDSDSTGAVTGNILGAFVGFNAIEDKWKENLELSDVIDELSMDLCHGCTMTEDGSYRDNKWITKYIDMERVSIQGGVL